MSARAASSALFLTLLIAPGLCGHAHAGPWLPAPGEYYSELRGGLFTADTYVNDSGDPASLGATWEQRSLLSRTELGWKKHASVVLAAPGVSVTRRDASGSVTSTGLEDFLLGLRFGLHQGPSALALELDWQAPLGYSRQNSLLADSTSGSGLQQLSASLLYGCPLSKRGFVQLGAGYGYRFLSITRSAKHAAEGERNEPKDLWSRPFLASADLGLWVTHTLLVGGRYSGSMTMAHGDLYPVRDVHLAGPLLLFRVDDRLDLMAGSWSSVKARNALQYDQYYVAIAFRQTKLNRLQGFLGGTKAP
jgi:hypothetical protein